MKEARSGPGKAVRVSCGVSLVNLQFECRCAAKCSARGLHALQRAVGTTAAMHAGRAGRGSRPTSHLQLVLAALELVKVGALAAGLDAVAGQAPAANHEGHVALALACTGGQGTGTGQEVRAGAGPARQGGGALPDARWHAAGCPSRGQASPEARWVGGSAVPAPKRHLARAPLPAQDWQAASLSLQSG